MCPGKSSLIQVQSNVEDNDTISKKIITRFNAYPGISYALVAQEAYNVGKVDLATRLLDFESSAGSQVPLLLKMQQGERALSKAVESGDTDLIYLALLHMKRTLTTAELFRIASGNALASSLLQKYLRHSDPGLLRDFFYQDDQNISSANLLILNIPKPTALDSKAVTLKVASRLYSEDKSSSLEVKVIQEELKLIQIQQDLEKEIGQSFVDLSIYQTIYKCLLLNQRAHAAKIKYDMKMSDKRFAYLDLKCLIEQKSWSGLEAVQTTHVVCQNISKVPVHNND